MLSDTDIIVAGHMLRLYKSVTNRVDTRCN